MTTREICTRNLRVLDMTIDTTIARVALDGIAAPITTTTEAVVTIGAYPTMTTIIDVRIKGLEHGAVLLIESRGMVVGTRATK